MNSVAIIGRLGQDPELRYTPSGHAVINLRVAINEQFGEKEQTTWVTVVVWDKLAEACHQYLRTGSRIAVLGRLQSRTYETNGYKRSVIEVVARRITFLDRARKRDEQPEAQSDPEPPPALPEEIPF